MSCEPASILDAATTTDTVGVELFEGVLDFGDGQVDHHAREQGKEDAANEKDPVLRLVGGDRHLLSSAGPRRCQPGLGAGRDTVGWGDALRPSVNETDRPGVAVR